MPNETVKKKKSLLSRLTSERLSEMLKEIDVSAAGAVKEGEYTARARLTALFDRGTFSETGRFMQRSSDPDGATGVITGYGSVDGRLCFAFAFDRSRMKGAFDASTGRKIALLIRAAVDNLSPLVGIFDSDGFSVFEGAQALSSMGGVMSALSEAGGVIPRIALVPGVCGGIEAALAASFDFMLTLSRPDGTGTDLFAVSPFLTGKSIDPAAEGLSCFRAASEAELASAACRLISLIPSSSRDIPAAAPHDEAEESRAPDITGLYGFPLIGEIADAGASFPLYRGFSDGLALALARVGGVSCLIVAGDRSTGGGALTGSGCDSLVKALGFADRFGIPAVYLTDSTGIPGSGVYTGDGDPAATGTGAAYLASLSTLSAASAAFSAPVVTLYTGRAYGAGYILLGSKALGADIVYALPDACISALSPESSVAFVWNEKIKVGDLDSSREMLEREWKEEHSPAEAALSGDIDDIVSPAGARPKIVSALYMLLGRDRGEKSRRNR